MNEDEQLKKLLIRIKVDGRDDRPRSVTDDIRQIRTILQPEIVKGWRPTTEIEKLHMKRKFIELANRMKCRYQDNGSWISVEIRPMTQIKQEASNGKDTQ